MRVNIRALAAVAIILVVSITSHSQAQLLVSPTVQVGTVVDCQDSTLLVLAPFLEGFIIRNRGIKIVDGWGAAMARSLKTHYGSEICPEIAVQLFRDDKGGNNFRLRAMMLPLFGVVSGVQDSLVVISATVPELNKKVLLHESPEHLPIGQGVKLEAVWIFPSSVQLDSIGYEAYLQPNELVTFHEEEGN